MKISSAGLVDIKKSEGFSSRPYLDTIAKPPVWTIGYGETKGIGPNTKPITLAEAERRLISRFEADYAHALMPFVGLSGFNQNMYDALGSFIWNCGTGAVGPNTTVGKRLRARRWRDAADALLAWNKTGGKVIEGLVNRRKRERALFLKPVAKAPSSYLTESEADKSDILLRERRIADRRGGWKKFAKSDPKSAAYHNARAEAAKAWLKQRVKALEAEKDQKKYDRSRRIQYIKSIL